MSVARCSRKAAAPGGLGRVWGWALCFRGGGVRLRTRFSATPQRAGVRAGPFVFVEIARGDDGCRSPWEEAYREGLDHEHHVVGGYGIERTQITQSQGAGQHAYHRQS